MLDMLCYACHFMLCCHCLIFSFYFFYFFYHCMCVCVLYHEYDFSNNNNYTYFTDLRSQSHITKRDLDLWRLRCPAAHPPIGATTIRTGGDLGDKQCIGPSKFLAVYFKKTRNFTASSHQNAGYSIWVFKNFPRVIPPDPHSGRGRPLPHPTPRPAFGRARGWDPNLGPPQLFSRGCAPAPTLLLYKI